MNQYEITFITKEDPAKAGPVQKEIESLGGKIISSNSLGQKQFAYPIKKETAGFYTTAVFEIEPTKVLELSKKLALTPEILRHLIIVAKAARIEVPKGKEIVAKEKIEKVEVPEKKAEIPIKKPKVAKKPVPVAPAIPKVAKELEADEISADERLKALDKKLDELLKE